MAELKDIIVYLLQQYPHAGELSNARVTKMVYLADWKAALDYGRQLSRINWFFDNYGPFVWDVFETVKGDPTFEIDMTANFYGSPKRLFRLAPYSLYQPNLGETEQAILRHVVEHTHPLSFDHFIRLVYSTYPIASSARYEQLDLVAKAQEYRRAMRWPD